MSWEVLPAFLLGLVCGAAAIWRRSVLSLRLMEIAYDDALARVKGGRAGKRRGRRQQQLNLTKIGELPVPPSLAAPVPSVHTLPDNSLNPVTAVTGITPQRTDVGPDGA